MNIKLVLCICALFLNTSLSQNNICYSSTDISRIVVAGGSITEIIYLLGQEDKIVAVDVTSNYPEEAKRHTSIGYVRNVSTEGILSLNPSLILGEDDMGPPNVVEQLKGMNMDLRIINEEQSIDGIIQKIRCVASIIDKKDIADKIIKNDINPILLKLKENQISNKKKRIKIMLVLSMQGTSPMVAGTGTSGDSFITMIGGENIFSSFDGWKTVTAESILKLNPDYIIIPDKNLHKNSKVEEIANNPIFKNTNAGRNNNFLYEDGMALLGFGPRTIYAAFNLSEKISD